MPEQMTRQVLVLWIWISNARTDTGLRHNPIEMPDADVPAASGQEHRTAFTFAYQFPETLRKAARHRNESKLVSFPLLHDHEPIPNSKIFNRQRHDLGPP
jgi:hypothetical protein